MINLSAYELLAKVEIVAIVIFAVHSVFAPMVTDWIQLLKSKEQGILSSLNQETLMTITTERMTEELMEFVENCDVEDLIILYNALPGNELKKVTIDDIE